MAYTYHDIAACNEYEYVSFVEIIFYFPFRNSPRARYIYILSRYTYDFKTRTNSGVSSVLNCCSHSLIHSSILSKNLSALNTLMSLTFHEVKSLSIATQSADLRMTSVSVRVPLISAAGHT